ncbi:hypothetical protein Q5L94_13465, partial [Idiomarina sp. Sol25]|uniref:hypothetical protein n=1 Tax=Idiomarina sp. Sol25 TaxID=3064000 RepID=UPI00294B1973
LLCLFHGFPGDIFKLRREPVALGHQCPQSLGVLAVGAHCALIDMICARQDRSGADVDLGSHHI